MLPDLPMPGATDPNTACGTSDYKLLLIPAAGELIMKQTSLSCWRACSNHSKRVKLKDNKLALEDIG